MRFMDQEEITYKQLISKFRLEGLSPELFARRVLSIEEVLEFYETYRLVQNSG